MSLFRKLNKILIVQSLFGLFPFKMNANNGKVEFCFFKWIYSIVVYGTISAASFYILINYTLRDFHAVFDNIAVTSKFLQIVNLEVVFAASIVGILFNRRKFVKFYNNLNAVDRKVERFRKPTDKSEKNLFHVYSLVFVFNFVLYFFVKLNLAAPVYLINSICVGLKIFALTLISLFIRSISSVLNNRMDIIVSTLGGMASGNFKKNIREIDECIRIFDELWHCKDSLSNVFGIHLLLFFCYDFIGMATFYYVLSTSFSYVVWPILPVLIKTLMYMVPYALKEVLVVVEMDKLGQQVIIMYSKMQRNHVTF